MSLSDPKANSGVCCFNVKVILMTVLSMLQYTTLLKVKEKHSREKVMSNFSKVMN